MKIRNRCWWTVLVGPEKFGYTTPLWTCERVAHLVGSECDVRYPAGHVWKVLRQLNWSLQRAVGKALKRNEGAIAEWKKKTWPAIKKSPPTRAYDRLHLQSGLSQRPHRCRTWAPRGQTPVLFHHFNWKTLSVIAGITAWNFYFELFEESIRPEHLVVFLQHLVRSIPGNLLVVWDRLAAHGSRLVDEYLDTLERRVEVEYLPLYAPEGNPVKYIWAYPKQHELPNVCPKNLWNLGEGARKALKKMQRKKRLFTFWKQPSLWP